MKIYKKFSKTVPDILYTVKTTHDPQILGEIENIIKSENLNCSVEEFKYKVNWGYISRYQKLSEDFIREFKDEVDWYHISSQQALSEDFIREFKDEVKWLWISYNQKLSEEFIREFKDKVDWDVISCSQALSEDFIREFKDKIGWTSISIYQKLSEDFIREFKDRVNWPYISYNQKLSEEFIKEFKDKIKIELLVQNPHCPPKIKIQYYRDSGQLHYEDPTKHEVDNFDIVDNTKKDTTQEDIDKLKQLIASNNINKYSKITDSLRREIEDIIEKLYVDCPVEEFKDYVSWPYISYRQKLSEEFIREFQDKVNWRNISAYQTLSEDFIREFKDKVNWFYISSRQNLSEEFIREFQDKVYWPWISAHQTLSEDFIREFKDKLDWHFLVKNPNCPPKLKIQYLRETGQLNYEDPAKHSIEYGEKETQDAPKPYNIQKDIDDLKKLIAKK